MIFRRRRQKRKSKYAGGDIGAKSKYAANGIYRSSRLTSLVVRRWYSGKCHQKMKFPFFIFLFWESSSAALHLSFCQFAVAGRTVGCSPPFVPLGRVHRPLHPEERKAFLIRLRRLTMTTFAIYHCIFSYTLPATSTVLFPVRIRPSCAALLASFRSASLHASYSAVPCLGAYDDDRFLLTNVCSV